MSEISTDAREILDKINFTIVEQAKSKGDLKADTTKAIINYFKKNYQIDVIVKDDPENEDNLIVYCISAPKYIEVDITFE